MTNDATDQPPPMSRPAIRLAVLRDILQTNPGISMEDAISAAARAVDFILAGWSDPSENLGSREGEATKAGGTPTNSLYGDEGEITNPSMSPGLKLALERFGGFTGLGAHLGMHPNSLRYWAKHGIPARQLREVESKTGIPRNQLRPDLYGKDGSQDGE